MATRRNSPSRIDSSRLLCTLRMYQSILGGSSTTGVSSIGPRVLGLDRFGSRRLIVPLRRGSSGLRIRRRPPRRDVVGVAAAGRDRARSSGRSRRRPIRHRRDRRDHGRRRLGRGVVAAAGSNCAGSRSRFGFLQRTADHGRSIRLLPVARSPRTDRQVPTILNRCNRLLQNKS